MSDKISTPNIPEMKSVNPLQKEFVNLVLIALSYWGVSSVGLLFSAPADLVFSVWTASGFTLAVLLLNPARRWRSIIVVVFLVNAAGNLGRGGGPLLSLLFAFVCSLEAYLSAFVLTHYIGSRITFRRAKEIIALFGVAVVINGATAALMAVTPTLIYGTPFLKTWWMLEAADGLGIILIAPLIVTWFNGARILKSMAPWKLAEPALFVGMTVTFAWLLFGPFTDASAPVLRNYMIFPILILLAFRFDPRGVAGTLFLFSLTALWYTLQGAGIFGFSDQSPAERLTAVQLFLIVATFSGMLLSCVLAERKRAEATMQARWQLSQSADFQTLDELLQSTLDRAEELTDSKIGFFHFLEEDQVTLTLQMWSTNTVKNMCTAEGKGQHYPVDKAGVWVDCVYTRKPVIYNDYATLSHRKGLPKGHAPVSRILVAPVLRDDKIVMIIGVGNKAVDYDDYDAELVSNLADLTWDIVRRKRVEADLRDNQELFSQFMAHSPIYAFIKQVDPDESRVLHASENYEEMIGVPGWKMIGKGMKELFPPELAEKIIKDDCEVITNGGILKLEEELKDRHYTTIKFPINLGEKKLLAGYTIDITDRVKAQEALLLSEEKYRTVADFTYDWEAWLGPDKKYRYVSPSCNRVTGYPSAEFLKDPAKAIEIAHPEDKEKVREHFRQANGADKNKDLHYEFRIITASGETRWMSHFCNAVYGNDGQWLGRRESNRDITERKLAEEELRQTRQELIEVNKDLETTLERERQLSHTDGLTGINNRRYLYELAEYELGIALRYHQPLSILMFDIDHFKQINDTYGHMVGDQILQQVARSTCAVLRSSDVIGRYGGEEFVIVSPMTTAQQAFSLAERIREQAAGVRVPTEKGDAKVTLSIGIVEKIPEAETASTDDLIRGADAAMYAAKQAGRNRTMIGRK